MKKGCLLLAVIDCLLAWMIFEGGSAAQDQIAEVFQVFAGQERIGGGGVEAADGGPGSGEADTAGRKNSDKPRVALTFDDGPHPVYTEQVLDELKKKNVKATFFIMGKNIGGNEKILKRMAKEGHLIGNHTFDHVNLKQASKEEICRQLGRTYEALYEITGQEPIFMRPPFGAWDKKKSCDFDVIPVLWTVDTMDWQHQNAAQTLNKVAGRVKDGDIILMHDQYKATVKAVGLVIDYLEEAGFDLVTVDEIVLD